MFDYDRSSKKAKFPQTYDLRSIRWVVLKEQIWRTGQKHNIPTIRFAGHRMIKSNVYNPSSLSGKWQHNIDVSRDSFLPFLHYSLAWNRRSLWIAAYNRGHSVFAAVKKSKLKFLQKKLITQEYGSVFMQLFR